MQSSTTTKWEIHKLADLLVDFTNKNKNDEEIPVYSVTNDEGFTISTDYFSKEVFSKNLKTYKIVEKGDFAYNPSRVNVGSIDFFQHEGRGIISPLYVTFRTDERLSEKYLKYYLKSPIGNAQIRNNTSGSVRDSLSFKGLSNISIPLPPIEEQERIVEEIEKISDLIQKRSLAVDSLEEYLRSIFIEMFGDPVLNSKSWEQDKFDNILKNIDGGWSPKCFENPVIEEGKWGVLKLSSISNCEYSDNENKELPETFVPRPNIEVQEGDLLFSRKNTYDLIGACAYVKKTKPNLMISDLIFRLKLKESAEILPIFLWRLLMHSGKRKQIQSLANGAAGSMPNISKAKLKTIDIIIPPLSLQKDFENICVKIDEVKQAMISQKEELNQKFYAFIQKSFLNQKL